MSALRAPRDLRASVYSDTTVELFWRRHDRDAWEIAQVEIYRDDELLAKTDHYDSYLDDTREPGRDYTYRVRYLPVVGAPGEFSRSLVVNASSGGFTVHARHPAEGDVAHAELAYGSSMIMIGAVRDDAYGALVGAPGHDGGKSIYVAVEEVDALHDRVLASGVVIEEGLVWRPGSGSVDRGR